MRVCTLTGSMGQCRTACRDAGNVGRTGDVFYPVGDDGGEKAVVGRLRERWRCPQVGHLPQSMGQWSKHVRLGSTGCPGSRQSVRRRSLLRPHLIRRMRVEQVPLHGRVGVAAAPSARS